MPTLTTHYDLQKPLVNDATDQDLWGGELNDDLDIIDTEMFRGNNWVKRVVSGTDAATTTDQNKILLGDATGGAYDQTLPNASDAGDGFAIVCLKTDATTNVITVKGAGSDTVMGAASFALNTQYQSIALVSDGVSNWNPFAYDTLPAASDTVAGKIETATQAEMEAEASTSTAVVPARVKYSPGIAKAWVIFDSNGTASSSYNVASITKNGTGDYTITFTTAINNPCPIVSCSANDRTNGYTAAISTVSSSSIRMTTQTQSGGAASVTTNTMVVYGDFS